MDTALLKTLALLLFIFASALVHGEIYKWVDEQGKVHFSDKKPDAGPVEKVDVRVNTYTNVTFDISIFDSGDKVVMYSTSWCGYCKKARNYFRQNGIRFTEYDIEKNQTANREYDQMGAKGVPVILVGNQRMNGFNEQGFKRLYDTRK